MVTNNNDDVGDHRCCPSGPPLSLRWTMVGKFHTKFETYQTKREPQRVRSKEELGLDGEARRGILRNSVVGVASANASYVATAHEEPSLTSKKARGDGRVGSRKPEETRRVGSNGGGNPASSTSRRSSKRRSGG